MARLPPHATSDGASLPWGRIGCKARNREEQRTGHDEITQRDPLAAAPGWPTEGRAVRRTTGERVERADGQLFTPCTRKRWMYRPQRWGQKQCDAPPLGVVVFGLILRRSEMGIFVRSASSGVRC